MTSPLFIDSTPMSSDATVTEPRPQWTSAEFSRIAPDVKIGEGVRIFAFVNLYGCSIGDNSKIGTFVEIQKNAEVGKNVKVSSHTFICEGVKIEDDVFIGDNVSFG